MCVHVPCCCTCLGAICHETFENDLQTNEQRIRNEFELKSTGLSLKVHLNDHSEGLGLQSFHFCRKKQQRFSCSGSRSSSSIINKDAAGWCLQSCHIMCCLQCCILFENRSNDQLDAVFPHLHFCAFHPGHNQKSFSSCVHMIMNSMQMCVFVRTLFDNKTHSMLLLTTVCSLTHKK